MGPRDDFDNRPPNWNEFGNVTPELVPGSEEVGNPQYLVRCGDTVQELWIYHWHRPTGKQPRWQLSGLGLHTIQQLDPLTLSPSLGCEDGCPSHGFIQNGQWVEA